MALTSIPGFYEGYVGARKRNEETELNDVRQAHTLMQIIGQQQERQAKQAALQRDEQMRQEMARSGGDVEAALQVALKSGNVAAAHQLAPLVEIARKKKQAEQFRMMTPEQLQDPDVLDRLGASGLPGTAHFTSAAERLRKRKDNEAQIGMMRSAPAINPDPQEVAQGADYGTPVPAAVPAKAGIFADLMTSADPAIAQAAKHLQAQVDRAGPNVPASFWQSAVDRLTQREATQAQMKERQKIIIDNRPVRGGPTGNAEDKYPGDFSKSGKDFLESLPLADKELVRKIAAYEIDPKTLSIRGGHRERALTLVSQYDPAYDDTQYGNKRRAIAQFGSGPQGNTVRSLNVAIEHIDTLQRAAEAMKNGSFTPGNRAYNEVAKVFGQTPPNTFEGIRDIVSNEVVKGTIGATGALEDRKTAAEKVKASASPQQLKELMDGWVELMGGQVKGLERQYEGSTQLKDFRKRYLTDRTQAAIDLAESRAKPSSGSPTGGAWNDEKERRYQELLKKRGS